MRRATTAPATRKAAAKHSPNVLSEMPRTLISGCTTPEATDLQEVHRVRDGAVDARLEVEVRAGRVARRAHLPDDLPARDRLPRVDQEGRLVAVARGQRGGVLDARVVPVATGVRGDDDLAGARRPDRRARGGRDVHTGVARLPRAGLAERRRDRAVDGPDELSVAADRAGRDRSGLPREAALDGAGLALQVVEVALERGGRAAEHRELRGAGCAHGGELLPLADEGALDALDLVAAVEHGDGERPLATLEPVEPVHGLRRQPLGLRDGDDHPAVLRADPRDELARLEEVGEPAGGEDDRHQVGALSLVELAEARREDAAAARE